MQKPRKIPQRMCVGCREKRDKKDLLRVVRTPEGQLVLDATGKKSGRGAYVCRDAQCLKKARKSRAVRLLPPYQSSLAREAFDLF